MGTRSTVAGGRAGGTAAEGPGGTAAEGPRTVRVSVVMPVYNERETLEEIVRRVRSVSLELELVVVDDGSTDGSRDVLRRLRDEGLVDQLLLHEENRGKGAALSTGFRATRGEVVIVQDADLEYDPDEYPLLLEPILEDKADVVYGSRFMGSGPHRVLYFWHYVGNRLLTLLSNMVTNLNLTDMETCYKCFRRKVLDSLTVEERAFGVEPELTAKVAQGRWRVYEVGISYAGRTYAEGKKITWKDGVWAVVCILRYGLFRRWFRRGEAARGRTAPRLAEGRSGQGGPGARSGTATFLLGAALLAAGCGDPANQAIERGDRLLGEGKLEAAIAEYRLARRHAGETSEVLLRLGHAYAEGGDVDESVRHFETLVGRDSAFRPQAAAELSSAARRSLERGAPEGMMRALRPLLEWNLGLIPRDLRLALARHFAREGEHARALTLYLSVASEAADVAGAPALLDYEIGRAYEELGGCLEAVRYFERYLAEAGGGMEEAASARWHLGNCLFLAAEEDRAAGRPRSALERLDRMVRLGVPQTLLERAHYLRGELLLALGDPERALRAYEEVLRLNPARSGYLVRRAEERMRDIRYGYRSR